MVAQFAQQGVSIAGVHKRIRPVGIRADGWWEGLADWWIPAKERIDRDRIGLRPAEKRRYPFSEFES